MVGSQGVWRNLQFGRTRLPADVGWSPITTKQVLGLFWAACRMGLEGLVFKRSDWSYRGGRSKDWIKIKNRQHQAFDRVKESFASPT